MDKRKICFPAGAKIGVTKEKVRRDGRRAVEGKSKMTDLI
jgi:hypothetical protein